MKSDTGGFVRFKDIEIWTYFFPLIGRKIMHMKCAERLALFWVQRPYMLGMSSNDRGYERPFMEDTVEFQPNKLVFPCVCPPRPDYESITRAVEESGDAMQPWMFVDPVDASLEPYPKFLRLDPDMVRDFRDVNQAVAEAMEAEYAKRTEGG